MITMSFGIDVERRTSSLVRIRSPSGVRPGRLFTREPVARMTSVAWSTRSPAAAGDPRHLVLVDQRLEPGPQPLHDLVLARGHLDIVDARLAVEHQAVVLGVMEVVR